MHKSKLLDQHDTKNNIWWSLQTDAADKPLLRKIMYITTPNKSGRWIQSTSVFMRLFEVIVPLSTRNSVQRCGLFIVDVDYFPGQSVQVILKGKIP